MIARERERVKPKLRRLVTDNAVVGVEAVDDKPKTLDPLCIPQLNTQTSETLIPCLDLAQGER